LPLTAKQSGESPSSFLLGTPALLRVISTLFAV
jgi:hypothetical protein